MFLDEVRIRISSGRGGDGIVHFRREKYVPRGGPDGGDGGKGGDVILEVEPTLSTLSSFRRKRVFRAEDGRGGGGNNKKGRDGAAVIIPVPPGTVVRDTKADQPLGDLVDPAQRLVVCRGGRGGRGNARFATPTNQAPRMAEKGEPGVERELHLELRLIADVGIVGVPNAGKSTLLAAVTRARPKIAPYPFTTLEPNLGVVEVEDEIHMVLADIPGLIEGAHQGAGLGTGFLRHIQRTRVLIHMVDGTSMDPVADFSQVNTEMALFDPRLSDKPQVVAVNKMDLHEVRDRWEDLRKTFTDLGHPPLPLSALAREGLRELLLATHRALEKEEPPVRPEILPVYTPEADPRLFEVRRDPDGALRVVGSGIERAAAMTYWEYDEAVRRFQRVLAELGVEQALREAGVASGDSVRIGEYELEWQEQ